MQILKLKNFSFLLILCASVFVVFSCGDDEVEPPVDPTACETEGLTYENYAMDFINQTCATSGCHDADAANNSTPWTMHNYEGVKAAIDAERFFGAINRDAGFNPMPKGGAMLSDCNLEKMEAWIADGSPE